MDAGRIASAYVKRVFVPDKDKCEKCCGIETDILLEKLLCTSDV